MKFKLHLFIFASSLILTGCGNQYWTRNDAIYLHTGDAVRSNIAVQVPDPWPKKSENTNIPMDPVKAQYAVDCYRFGISPSDSLGVADRGYGPGSGGRGATAGGGGGGVSDARTCQETGAKPKAPEGTENQNRNQISDYRVESSSNGENRNNPPDVTVPLR